jgi:pimeloyl-ACP methyl ester carboxylesterase
MELNNSQFSGEKTIEINGIKTFIRIKGEGEPLLILHGWGVGLGSWINVQDELSKYFKVITLDLPGFGKSDFPEIGWGIDDYVQFILDLISSLGINKFHLVGHSFGGRICIKLAVKHPERIIKMILIDSAGIRHKKTFRKKLCYFIASILNPFSNLPGYQLLQKFFYKFILRNTNYLEAKGTKRETYIKVVKEDLTPFLEKIKVPTLIIWGKRDKITPLKDGYLMHKKIKNSELRILDCSHNPHLKIPEVLAKTILEFINK